MPKTNLILLAMEPSPTLDLLERALRSAGYTLAIAKTPSVFENMLMETSPTLVIISEKLGDKQGLAVAATVLERFPTLPIIFYASSHDPEMVLQAMRAGLNDYLYPPLKIIEIVHAIQRSQKRAQQMSGWVKHEVRHHTASLEKRVSEMDILVKLSRSITASLNLDSVLTNVVTAAVELTGAEESHLLLPDEGTNELYMRAGRNYDEGFAHTFRLPVKDSLAGQVMESGKPISFNQDAPNKIKTAYLVYALIYVPLSSNGRTIGVLGVDNRSKKKPFTSHDELLMNILADFAVIAIQNAKGP